MEKLSATGDQMENVGKGTSACLKDLSVLFHAILLLRLSVQKERLYVTLDQVEDAG